eukprot:15599940-Heterocapsa_arctica.AAC.1
MDYLKIVEVNALEPCNIFQLSLKEQILEIDAKVGDVVPEGFVLKVLKMQLILTELTCEVGPGGPHAPEYRCRV